MPTYLFQCDCEKVTELILSMDEEHTCICECGKEAKKVYTVIPAIFKGSGWGSKP
jgi:putative FmdB family regulatory protein